MTPFGRGVHRDRKHYEQMTLDAKQRQADRREAVLEALRGGALTTARLVGETGINKRDLETVLRQLKREQLIASEVVPAQWTYRLLRGG